MDIVEIKKYKLYEFYSDCGQTGSLDNLFIATEEQVNALDGVFMYFGDVLGKHSDVRGVINVEEDIIEKDVPSYKFLLELYKIFGRCISGNVDVIGNYEDMTRENE